MLVLVCCFSFILGFFIRSLFARFEIKKTVGQLKGLSADMMQKNNESFLQLAHLAFEKYQNKAESEFEKKNQTFEKLITPVKESLEQVDGKIQELEKARIYAYAGLKQQVELLLQSQKEQRLETSNLVKALRQPSARGRWGEIQLKRVVEMAGMLEHCDFYEQQSLSTSTGRLRPDLIVRLPGKKQIIIDAKAPLEAYLEAIETEDDAIKHQKFTAHARQIRYHINELSKKNYWDQFADTPEFVVLFLPGEPFFSAALQHDPELIEAGVEQKVILATPTTLIALLRAANYGWRQEKISQNAEEVAQLGKELYKRLCDMCGHWSKLGRHLNTAITSYNQAIGSFESRVMPQVRKFKELKSVCESNDVVSAEPVDIITRQLASEIATTSGNIASDDKHHS